MSFEDLRRDLHALACDDTLDVVRRAPVLRGVQSALVDGAQALYDAAIDALQGRTLDDAVGVQLEVLGRIVGLWPRPLEDAGALVYFGPDAVESAPDQAIAYVIGAPLAGQVPIGDPRYRVAIRAKIVKNHTRYGSAPELMNYGMLAFGIPVSVKNIGNSDLEVVLPASAPASAVAAILTEYTDETVDHAYALPLPTTARIARVSFRYPDAFAPDLDNGAPDVGYVGISYVVNP